MWLQEQAIEETNAKNRPFALSLATTFIAQVVKTHPDYIERFAQDFPHFSPLKKSIFQRAFSLAEIKDTRIPENETSPIMPLSELNHLEFKSGDDFDLMIVSFLATGNELFLSQPMAFLNSDPELLFFAYEWNNRKFLSKLLKELTGQTKLPDEAEFQDTLDSWPQQKKVQFSLRLVAWHCLDIIKGEDPTAEKKISELCKNDPRIDYQGTLTNLLK